LEKGKYKNDQRSFCDFCGQQLHWYENIPVVSWIIQGGKSRCCKKRLPIAYPIVEIGIGILFLITNYELKITNYWLLGIELMVVTLLVFSAVFDLKYMILPNFAEYILIGMAMISLTFKANWWQYLAVGLVFYIIFRLLAKIKIKGKQAMGEGDAPLAGFIGLWLGWPLGLVALYVAFIVGAVVGGGMILLRKKKGNEPIPFGPFLILGTFIAYWSGRVIINLIIR
jgi:leader peptidase (prepilin peptidase)/N-methyltransferase